jgi:predicted transcriptional regulator
METKRKRKKKMPKVPTSIKMEPEVADYLGWLANQFQRDRTFLINAIISEHAQRHRGKVPPPLRIIPM